jgi:hypothetical protein
MKLSITESLTGHFGHKPIPATVKAGVLSLAPGLTIPTNIRGLPG